MCLKYLLLYIFRKDMVYLDLSDAFDKLFKSAAEVAVICNVSEAVVQSWFDANLLKKARIKDENYVFIGDLEDFLQTRI